MAISLVVAFCTRVLVRVDTISVCPAVSSATFTSCAPEVTIRFFDDVACRVQVFVGVLADLAATVTVVLFSIALSSTFSAIVLNAATLSSGILDAVTLSNVSF